MPAETNTIVITGATGDLAQRKPLPALFQLRCKKRLPPGLNIVGFAHLEYQTTSIASSRGAAFRSSEK